MAISILMKGRPIDLFLPPKIPVNHKHHTLINSDAFRAELPGWALRGILCAATSAFWAVLMGFQAPTEIVGMIAGVAGWVAVFATVCAWLQHSVRWSRTRASAALKWAAGIKIGLVASGWLAYGVGGLLQWDDMMGMALFGMVDPLLGLASLALVSFFGGMNGPETVAAADSLGWTLLTTVIEGLLMALVIACSAVLVWGFWQARDALQKRRLVV